MPIFRFVEPALGQRRLHAWRVRGSRILVLIGLLVAACTLGLALLDDSREPFGRKLLLGLWNAVNLVSTLGDFSDFDLRQKVFMLGAMLCVMVVGAFAVGQLTGILSSPEVVAYRENRQMQKLLERLDRHAIVLGFDGLGRLLAQRLRETGQAVVVIERDPSAAARASALGFPVIQGDAGSEDGVLASAGLERAQALYVSRTEALHELTVVLQARRAHAGLRIVASAPDAHWAEMLQRAGASEVVITDQVLAGAMISRTASAAAL